MTTLQQIVSQIDELYPVAGKDNDSQGFRDNFNYIKTALTTVNEEAISLQSNTILTSNLVTGDPVDNDLAGSSINNGYYNNFYGVAFVANASGANDIFVTNGSVQQFRITSNSTFTFRDWPADTKYAVIRIHFLSNGAGTWDISMFTEGGGDVIFESNFPIPFTVSPGIIVPTDSKHKVIEAWSYNNGASVYVRYLGEF